MRTEQMDAAPENFLEKIAKFIDNIMLGN